MNEQRLLFTISLVILFLSIVSSCNVKACKDIIACGDATAGDYNLLLKVRDPSRSGLQVLCIVPEGYEYSYHNPWNGKPINFKTNLKYIGVATKVDTIPNIVKAGMAISEAGISYGDADTDSNWKNPTKYAWDDFDWIRYACEKANNEYEAASLMTTDVVKKMHATAVSENLFIVGPNKGIIVEADAFHYKVKEISDGIAVMSNYPKELWKTQIFKKLSISRSFDTIAEKYVKKGEAVRLKSLYGIRVVEIGSDYIVVKPIFLIHALKTSGIGIVTKISLGERKTVGYYSVELLDINGNKAEVRVCNRFKAWEEKMLEYIEPKYGKITVRDMVNWSRLEKNDLDNLRPMCEELYEYEAVAVYKIPKQNYETLSSGWFSPNHACSSIYVPFHICDNDIYDTYETGEAAELSLELLNYYGHDTLTPYFSKAEDVFLFENEFIEKIAVKFITKNHENVVSDLLTISDIGMQQQAWLTEGIWIEISKMSGQKDKLEFIDMIDGIWEKNYTFSLEKMGKVLIDNINKLRKSSIIIDKLEDIAIDICKTKIDVAGVIGKQSPTAKEEYETGKKLVKQGEYEQGFNLLEKAFTECDMLIKGQIITGPTTEKSEEKTDALFYFLIALLFLVVVLFLLKMRQDSD